MTGGWQESRHLAGITLTVGLAHECRGVFVTLQAPLFDIGPIMVSVITDLEPGSYTFFFTVDTNADGGVGAPIYYDYVIVKVNASGMDIEGEGQEGVEGEAIDTGNTTSAEGYYN